MNLICESREDKTLKEEKLNLISLTQHPKYIDESDIKYYLKKTQRKHPIAIKSIYKHALTSDNYIVQLHCIRLIAKSNRLTNDLLKQIWKICYYNKNRLLGWKSLTILTSRENISNEVKKLWQASHENTSTYICNLPNKKEIDICTFDFPEKIKSLILYLLKAGLIIGEIRYLSDSYMQENNLLQENSGNISKNLNLYFNNLSWVKNQKKKYFYEFKHSLQKTYISHLLDNKTNNCEWYDIMKKIIYLMSLHIWNGSLRQLKTLLTATMKNPKIKNTQTMLNKLTIEQKVYLRHIARLSEEISQDDFEVFVQIFVFRLSSIIYPNHLQALRSIQKIDNCLHLLGDLENWLISKEYTDYTRQNIEYHSLEIPTAPSTSD